jgi:hypothetical protein
MPLHSATAIELLSKTAVGIYPLTYSQLAQEFLRRIESKSTTPKESS